MMSIEIIQIPIWEDNYIYLLHESISHKTAAIDPTEGDVLNKYLKEKKWNLDFIFSTHHHRDHTGGNLELKKKWGCKIYGYKGDAKRIPGIDRSLEDGEIFPFGSINFKVLFLPGHTLGHIAYWSKEENILFCGDCLFAMGCGRLFEGTAKQMFSSLSKIKELNQNTLIYCAHEYSLKNAQFALTVTKENPALKERAKKIRKLRKEKKSTIPFTLKEELLTNPFLRAKTLQEFAKLRALRDQF